MSDLHARLTAAVTAQLEVARAAGSDRWVAVALACVDDSEGHQVVRDEYMRAGVQAHIAANDPATVIRHCVRDLRVLERHAPVHIGGPAAACQHEWADGDGWIEDYPCDDLRDLATAYEVELSL